MRGDDAYGELEIGLSRAQRGVYEVTLRLTDPQSQAEVSPVRGSTTLDAEALLSLQSEPGSYGRALAAQVFVDPQVRALYGKARAAFERSGLLLRVRIAIDATALELHDLRWEVLRDPDTDAPLATSERVVLSRFMRSRSWRRVRPRTRQQSRAVVAIAAPRDLGRYGLDEVDAAREVAGASAALSGIGVAVVGDAEPLTLDRFVDALRSGADIVYLICHGMLSRQLEPILYLCDDAGATAPVKGSLLAQRLGELPELPRLVVLASCESAGRADATATGDAPSVAHGSLAPLLAEAGVPAVLAMQDKITVETVRLCVGSN
jgi:hypothetical protein